MATSSPARVPWDTRCRLNYIIHFCSPLENSLRNDDQVSQYDMFQYIECPVPKTAQKHTSWLTDEHVFADSLGGKVDSATLGVDKVRPICNRTLGHYLYGLISRLPFGWAVSMSGNTLWLSAPRGITTTDESGICFRSKGYCDSDTTRLFFCLLCKALILVSTIYHSHSDEIS